MPLLSRTTAFSRVTAIAAQRAVHGAFAWIHGNPKTILDWQRELCAIPAPPFGEAERSRWLAARFGEFGLEGVETDEAGNVMGYVPTPHLAPQANAGREGSRDTGEYSGPVVVLSAHLDTVFPAGTVLQPVVRSVDGTDRLECPGACDNCAGVAGMLAVARALLSSGAALPCPLLLVGNVGEEGEGDLRGMRHLYGNAKLAGRIAAHVVLDGAGADSAVTQALGSRRFQLTIAGPGGHSFTDAGTPNPIAALASALASIAATVLPDEPRTTLNLGTIHGGTSVNSIPESATATVDFRSTSAEELIRLEVALHRAAEDAVLYWNGRAMARTRGLLRYAIQKIGDRPAAVLPEDSPVLHALRAVDRHLGLQTGARLGSTDGNIPLSLGVPAISLGAGGEGGGAHTLGEWYSTKDREVGLRRVLLLTLAVAEWAAEQ
ncbi:M20/M25/M40 family metallo-hydrolase [Acidobacteria bacterium AB60]|nr:M20/M25/M40 family metallo-hydrolase [Acidobacteria bacterium AB60]